MTLELVGGVAGIKTSLLGPSADDSTKQVYLYGAEVNCGALPYFDGTTRRIDGPDEAIELRELRMHRDGLVRDFPLLWCAARPVDALAMNLFMEHRYRGLFAQPKVGGKRNLRGGVIVQTLWCVANSLRGFLGWLAHTDTDWRETFAVADSDRAKAWLPPYRFRSHLIDRVEAAEISRDTANLYISHVRQFYEWAVRTERMRRVPFEYTFVPISKPRKDGGFDLLFDAPQAGSAMMVQTSDLAIPKKYKKKTAALDDGLTPYSLQELTWLFGSEHMQLAGRRLWAQMAYVCGLRAHEVVALPEDAVVQPSGGAPRAFPFRVLGKGNKERTVLVPTFLMEALYLYKNSDERLHRAAKWDLRYGTDRERPMFLNRSGARIASASLTNLTSCVAKDLAKGGVDFRRSFHDLRATFATSLARFMLERQMPLGFIQYKLMALLGHDNFSTTQKYINFARTVTFEHQMQDWVDQIFGGLGPMLDGEAKR